MIENFGTPTFWVDLFFFLYFGIINLIYTILLILGAYTVFARQRQLKGEDFNHLLQSNTLPEISFLIPAYNEAADIVTAAENLINLTYRYKQIIITNDGSTDNTMQLLIDRFEMVPIPMFYEQVIPTKTVKQVYRSVKNPELIVIDKENGKRDDALNACLNACFNRYCIVVDADTYVDNESFEALIHPMLTSPEMVAMGASIRIRNGCLLNYNRINTKLFPIDYYSAMQSLEYLRGFLMRQGWNYMGGNFCLSGAFSIFLTDLIKKMGGFSPTFANDLEITVRLHRVLLETNTPYKIEYLPDPAGWTDVPDTYEVLAKQRNIWHRATMEAAWYNRSVFFNPRCGWFGMMGYPFLIFGEVFEPVVECLGYIYVLLGWWFNFVNVWSIFLLLCIILGLTFVNTLFALIIEELSFKKYPSLHSMSLLFLYSLIENIGYRQMTVWWRLKGFFEFFKKFPQVEKESKVVNKQVKELVKQGKIKF